VIGGTAAHNEEAIEHGQRILSSVRRTRRSCNLGRRNFRS
jgi:hypothetical protein